ncbi:MAG: Glycerate dehydrogenase [Pseudomonadota bacterium]
MKPARLSALVAALFATGGISSPVLAASPAPEVTRVIERHRLESALTPARDSPLWRAPRKVLLLQFGNNGWTGQAEAMRSAAPGVEIIAATDRAAALAAAPDADVIMGFNPEICDPQIIGSAERLRWLASLAAGVENCMDLPTVRKRSVMMTNMRGIDSPVIAEHAIALLLALAHGLDRFALDTNQGVMSRTNAARVPMQFLEGKTLLVVGLGGIGTEIAQRASGLGMEVVATRQGGSGKPEFVRYVGQPDELLKLAREADVVVGALPLTAETTGIFNAKFFDVLKPNAFFINIARGGSVVTADLVAALNAGKLAEAGLDVTEPEPLPADHPLWKAPRVLITPHISARSDLPGEARWTVAVENMRRYAAGEPMLSVVDLARGY